MQLRNALRTVYIIYSVIALLLVLVAVFVPADTVLRHAPGCYSVTQFGRECFMCGSTRGFLLAGSGNLHGAAASNMLSPVLFILFAINSIVLIFLLSTKSIKNKP